ncbi:MAG: serine acetyltransferase [Spirochaetia bacterium]|nr:serine acetyltransferase [Spirochaetia bacterium]
MDFNDIISETAAQLEESIKNKYHVEVREELGFSGRQGVYDILDNILSILFPGCFCDDKIKENELNPFLNERLRYISYKFLRYLNDCLRYNCHEGACGKCSCDERAHDILNKLFRSLPEVRDILITDINAAKNGDPAAESLDEIVFSYPFLEAIATHRIAHILYLEKVPIIPRMMSERAHSKTGIDIHPGASIGESFFIDHGTGVVIGETTTIGNRVKIYQGVTLGALSPFDRQGVPLTGKKRHPDIQDDVIIYANATILGGDTVIGQGSIIGGNTWLTHSVPPHSMIYNKAN